MRVGLIFTFLILSASLLGQSIYQETIKLKSGELNLASIKDTLKPDHLIIAFTDDAGERWKYTSWAHELHWLAADRNALIVAPETKSQRLTWSELSSMMNHFKDSVQSLNRTEFISLGSGASLTSSLISNGFNGLIISPSEVVSNLEGTYQTVVGLVSTTTVDSGGLIIDSLSRAGQWVIYEHQQGADYYYIDGYKHFYSDVFDRVDSSSQELLKDSLHQKKTEVINNLPDVIREGQQIEINVLVQENGDFLLDLLNLSAESVFHEEMYLGKGKHTFRLNTNDLEWGVYKVQIDAPKFLYKHKIMIRG